LQQHLIDGVVIEQPLVQRFATDEFRYVIVKGLFVLFFFFFGQFIVTNAMFHELQLSFHRSVRHKEVVVDRLLQFIGIGGHVVLQTKDVVGVFIDVILGSGGQSDQQAIEVVKNGFVFFIDAAVRFVDDDQVEVPDREQFPAAIGLGFIDGVHHCRVCREHNAAVGVIMGVK